MIPGTFSSQEAGSQAKCEKEVHPPVKEGGGISGHKKDVDNFTSWQHKQVTLRRAELGLKSTLC